MEKTKVTFEDITIGLNDLVHLPVPLSERKYNLMCQLKCHSVFSLSISTPSKTVRYSMERHKNNCICKAPKSTFLFLNECNKSTTNITKAAFPCQLYTDYRSFSTREKQKNHLNNKWLKRHQGITQSQCPGGISGMLMAHYVSYFPKSRPW